MISSAICNGNRTKWSSIRSVIIGQLINKIVEVQFVHHKYDYRIGRHEVLLPIKQNYDKI